MNLRIDRVARNCSLWGPLAIYFRELCICPCGYAETLWGKMPLREFKPAHRRGLFRFMKHKSDIDGIRFNGLNKIQKVLLR